VRAARSRVFAKWKGRAYARQYVTPAYTNTTSQQETRSAFSWLQAVYKVAPTDFVAAWALYATGKPLTERNAFTKFNLSGLKGETDLANFVFSPGALGGLPPASIAITPGSGQLSVAVTPPSPAPTDWTITKAIVAAILDQDPQTDTDHEVFIGNDATDPYVVVLTGLDTSLYRVGAWLQWTRPDGKTAYSPAVVGSDTPS